MRSKDPNQPDVHGCCGSVSYISCSESVWSRSDLQYRVQSKRPTFPSFFFLSLKCTNIVSLVKEHLISECCYFAVILQGCNLSVNNGGNICIFLLFFLRAGMLFSSVLPFKSTGGPQYFCPCANCYLVIRAKSRFPERASFLVHTDIWFSEYANLYVH